MTIKFNKEKDYCTMSPDTILGTRINYGCYLHDRHYRNERKVRLTRKATDRLLRNHIYKRLKESNAKFELRLRNKKLKIDILFFESDKQFFKELRKKLAFLFSRIYYYVVRVSGWALWV